jgi:type II secretory pathway component PulL
MSMQSSMVIFLGPAQWRVGAPTADGPAAKPIAGDDVAARIAATAEIVASGSGVLLALPAEWCLCARILLDPSDPETQPHALLYLLEEQLPLAAEDIAADFCLGDGEAFGVAVQRSMVHDLVEQLELRGVCIQSICPASLLALQHGAAAFDLAQADGVVMQEGEQVELFLLHEGRPVGWHLLDERDGQSLAAYLNAIDASASRRSA